MTASGATEVPSEIMWFPTGQRMIDKVDKRGRGAAAIAHSEPFSPWAVPP